MLLPLPSRLNLDHYYTFSSDLLTPLTTLPAILMHAAVVALAFWLWRRHRLSALLIFLYYLSHLIESTTLGLDLMFEHRMSLPMVFLMILFCFWLWRGMVILFGENRRAVCAFSAIVVFLSLGLGGLTATRLQAWESQRIFIEDMYRKAPNNARVVFSLGREYWLEGNYAEGEKYFVRAMQLDPYDWKAPTNLAVVYSDQKRCKEAVEIVDHLMTMFTAQPAHYRVLGMCAEQYEQFDKSIQYHKKSLELMPDMPETRLFIARNYQKQGMLDVARRYAMEELKFYPDDEVALRFLDFLDEKEREVQ
jgi:Tfp pilus assembly protein PilF